jgi:hypothetical protein
VLIDATGQSKTPKNNMIILHNKDQQILTFNCQLK